MVGASSHDRGTEGDAARRAPTCALVIFGASGDLTERKLLPAIRQLAAHRRLRPEFALVGVARTAMSDEEWADKCLSDHPGGTGAAAEWAPKASFRYVSGGYDNPETYRRLGEVLDECDRTLGTTGHRVFYLATPPRLFGIIAVQLGACGLNVSTGGTGRGWSSKSRSGGTRRAPAACTRTSAPRSKSRRSSASITIWLRTPFRTCWPCASPIRSSSRSGTGTGSTTCRSRWPRRSGWVRVAGSTMRRVRCATSSRTMCCRCCRCS